MSERRFDRQPRLRGRRVALRPLEPGDYDALRAAASDPRIWEQHPEKDRHREPVFRRFFEESLRSGGALVVIDVETGQIVGASRFHGYDAEAQEVEIGWSFLARSHWGGATNGEVKRLMLRHALRTLRSVVFYVSPGNRRSQRAMEKIGGVREPEHDTPDRLVYRIRELPPESQ